MTRGVSLVEVLVAFAILGVLLTPLISLKTTSRRQTAVSRLEAAAQIWGRQAITNLSALPYDDLLLIRGHSNVEAPGLEPIEGFPGMVNVSVLDADSGHALPWMVKVRVTVTWSPFGKTSSQARASLVLERFVCMPELGTALPMPAS
ncbi:MAG: prepilin-type N-terminal cleavage/methylation domain-containing protein [Candidatus Riflebacteria bacterium]|nr:prepilin-type N-terminal cleavage/methylation domain-containing protein [Candidatus Riflebacteria bacterium]